MVAENPRCGWKVRRRLEKSPNTSSPHQRKDLHGVGQNLDLGEMEEQVGLSRFVERSERIF